MIDPTLFLQDLAVILISATIGGYICRRLGLSSVVGYITAGLIVGTPEIVFPYVTDEERIALIAQLGVVFLMFSIGLQFRLRRVRELGIRVILSTVMAALLVLSAVRFTSDLLGLSPAAGIALAAVFMNSSSAIISKIIQETGIGHERHGQLALGTTLLEDIVAVVMLTVLSSYIVIEGSTGRGPGETIGLLVGFAIIFFVLGILLLPAVLRQVGFNSNSEAISNLVTGILLLAALIAVKAGYSLALGAFLCGMVVAETRQKAFIERNFQGLKDIFLTIFFVTIGMMVDIQAFPGALKWILLGTAGALVGRALATFLAQLLVGEHPKTALRTSLCLTPLGEFSFIIAGVAVAGGIFSANFQVAVVGTVLGTSLLAPLIAANGNRLASFLSEGKIPALDRAHAAYGYFWHSLTQNRGDCGIWSKVRIKLLRTAVAMLVVSTLLIFAYRFYDAIRSAQPGIFAHPLSEIIFWCVLAGICLVPLIAVWRNVSALAQALADQLGSDPDRMLLNTTLLAALIRLLFVILLTIWIWNLLPTELPRPWILASAALLLLIVSVFAWRSVLKLLGSLENALNQNLAFSLANPQSNLFDNWRDDQWELNVKDFVIPDDSPFAGITLNSLALRQRTGCFIVGIERHGYALSNIGPTTHLFPGDELLLLGNDNQINAAKKILASTGKSDGLNRRLESQILKSLRLPANSSISAMKLAELQWTRNFGVQVLALRRKGETLANPDGKTRILEGDMLLLLGTEESMQMLAKQVADPASASSGAPGAD